MTVPSKRNVDPRRRQGVNVIWQDVEAHGLATTPLQTVLDCASRLPLHEALAIADSALRAGAVGEHELIEAASGLGKSWRRRALEVVRAASPLADNPFESVVRAHAMEVPGLHLVPQVFIPGYGRADLADVDTALIVECDSFGFHSSRGSLLNDIERYNRAAGLALTLVRFGYEHAHQPAYIQATLAGALHPEPQEQVRSRREAA
ncbi:hypothetical protein KLP28_09690 [Nocardioidaceae bacterium]|nr:hypothetical protein KLP28_09690 [Nocardioidaceae bacterium]